MRRSSRRIAALAAAALTTTALAGGALLAPAPAEATGPELDRVTTSVTDTPATGCYVPYITAVDSSRMLRSYFYSSGNAGSDKPSSNDAVTIRSTYVNKPLSFTPTTMVYKEYTDYFGASRFVSDTKDDYYATSPDGGLYVIGVMQNGSVKEQRVSNSWGSVRDLTMTRGQRYNNWDPSLGNLPLHAYALTKSGELRRYTVPDYPANMANTTIVVPSGLQSVRGIDYYYSKRLANGDIADVLLATTTSGSLFEYTIPRKEPAKWTRATVRDSTWGQIVDINVGRCNDGTAVWVGIHETGSAWLYTDSNIRTARSADVRGLLQIGTGWKTVY